MVSFKAEAMGDEPNKKAEKKKNAKGRGRTDNENGARETSPPETEETDPPSVASAPPIPGTSATLTTQPETATKVTEKHVKTPGLPSRGKKRSCCGSVQLQLGILNFNIGNNINSPSAGTTDGDHDDCPESSLCWRFLQAIQPLVLQVFFLLVLYLYFQFIHPK